MGRKFHIDRHEKEVLLDKYLRGECTPGESAQIRAWFGSLQREDQQWHDQTAGEQEKYLADLYRDIQSSTSAAGTKKPVKKLRRTLLRIAASLIIIFGISLLFQQYYSGNSDDAVKHITEKSLAGEVKELRLPDGSLVWLNKGTTIRYPEVFAAGKREVFLEGEAFFEVTRDETSPFIIHSQGLQTRVLGTSFNVQAYRGQKTAQVVVVTGKVAVSRSPEDSPRTERARAEKARTEGAPMHAETNTVGQAAAVLTAKEMVTFNHSDKTLKAEQVNNTLQYTAWKDDKLEFRQTAMSEVAPVLEKAFGLKIKLENQAIERCRITGRFDKSQAAELTIKAICKSIEAQYRIADGTVFIRGRGCSE